MANEKENLPRFEDYRDSIVAFIDILGFTSKVYDIKDEESFKNPATLLYVFKKYETLPEDYKENGDLFFNDITITAVSDSIIITMPYNEKKMNIHPFIQTIGIMQYNLLATDFGTLLRGYITRGSVYHKDGIILGKGYNEACEGEGKIGASPRIVVDDKIIKEAKKAANSYKGGEKRVGILKYIKQDNDSRHFIDYLSFASKRDKIKKFIEKNLETYKNDGKVRAKYEWLKEYLEQTEGN